MRRAISPDELVDGGDRDVERIQLRGHHGKVRLRFRRKGFPSYYFKAALGTEEFRAEYAACIDPDAPAKAAAMARVARAEPGSLLDLFNRYVSVPDRLGPSEVTQKRVRSILEHFVTGRETRSARDVRFDHIDKIIPKTRIKTGTGNKTRGGVEAARKLRKELLRMFAFAVKAGMRKDNPVEHADKVKTTPEERSRGFHTWTEDEIAQYRAKHALGTNARLAMELILWTDQRKVVSIHLGRQHIEDGRFRITQTNTG